MFLRQIDFIKPIGEGMFDIAFRNATDSIVEMYWYRLYVNKLRTKSVDKFIIYTEKTTIYDIQGNYSVVVKIDIDNFYRIPSFNKKKLILDTIHNCLLSIADEQEIDKDKLQQAYNYCIENNLENRWLLGGKQIKSPSKKYYGAIECYWETDFFQITAIVYDNKKNELFRKELLKVTYEKPTGYLGYIYQYKPAWEVDNKDNEYLVFDVGNVFLKDQIKTKKWMINPDNQNIKTENKEVLAYLENLEG